MTVTDRVRVGDVLSLERREIRIDPLDEYRLIGVYSFGKGIFHRDPRPGAELGDYRFFRVEPGDLVLSNIQAWEGAIAHAIEDDRGTVGTHRFLSYVSTTPRIDTNWARWFFLSEPGMQLIRRAAPGTAVRNRTLAVKRFEDLEIPLPPIDEQRRVAARLDRVHTTASAISRLSGRVAALSGATGNGLASPEHLTPFDRRSQGWTQATLGEVMRPSAMRVTVDPVCEYRLAGVYSFGKGLIDRGRFAGADTSYKIFTVLHEDDVVVSKLNGWEGAVAVVSASFAGACVSSEFPTFVVDQARLNPSFFRGIATSPAFWRILDATARGSMVRRRRISVEEFLRATIWLPNIVTQADVGQRMLKLEHLAKRRTEVRDRVSAVMPALLNHTFAR